MAPNESFTQLLFAGLPRGYSLEAQRLPELLTTRFVWTRESDGMDVELMIGDENWRKIDYPDLFAEAATEEVMKKFASVPYEVPQTDA